MNFLITGTKESDRVAKNQTSDWLIDEFVMPDEIFASVTRGELWASDDPAYNTRERLKHTAQYYTKYIFAADSQAFSISEARNGNGRRYNCSKELSQFYKAFVRIRDDVGCAKLLVVDCDEPMSHEKWLDYGFPTPNRVIINPITRHSQWFYFLEKWYTIDGIYKDAWLGMNGRVGGDLLATICNYRSLHYSQNGRKKAHVCKGVKPKPLCGFFYIIDHHDTEYCVIDLADQCPPLETASLDEKMFECQPKQTKAKKKSGDHISDGHSAMWDHNREACGSYNPELSDQENYNNIFAVYSQYSTNREDIKHSSRSTLKYCNKKNDPTKKKPPRYDHSSATQRFKAEARWEHSRLVAETKGDAAKRLGVSRQSIHDWIRSGRLLEPTQESRLHTENPDFQIKRKRKGKIGTVNLREKNPLSLPPLL